MVILNINTLTNKITNLFFKKEGSRENYYM